MVKFLYRACSINIVTRVSIYIVLLDIITWPGGGCVVCVCMKSLLYVASTNWYIHTFVAGSNCYATFIHIYTQNFLVVCVGCTYVAGT